VGRRYDEPERNGRGRTLELVIGVLVVILLVLLILWLAPGLLGLGKPRRTNHLLSKTLRRRTSKPRSRPHRINNPSRTNLSRSKTNHNSRVSSKRRKKKQNQK